MENAFATSLHDHQLDSILPTDWLSPLPAVHTTLVMCVRNLQLNPVTNVSVCTFDSPPGETDEKRDVI